MGLYYKKLISRWDRRALRGMHHVMVVNLYYHLAPFDSTVSRKKNVVVTGLPEVDMGTTGTSSDESKRLDEVAFTTFCEENLGLTVKPAVSKLGCRRLGKATGTKPRRLLVHLSSEQNAQDLLICESFTEEKQ